MEWLVRKLNWLVFEMGQTMGVWKDEDLQDELIHIQKNL
jgi:hypothetical protein